MSDEDAFLAALAENPADDVRRLVYADWLEERGETEKATYLRLTCRAVEALGTPEEEAVVGQLVAASSSLSPEWQQAAAGRFGLVVWGIPGDRKLFAIKFLREHFGWGLAEAKDQSERLPNHLPLLATAEVIQAVRERFTANIHTDIVLSDWGVSESKAPSPRSAARPYDIYVAFYFFDPDLDEGDHPENVEAATNDITAFVERVGEPGAVARNTTAPSEGFSATILNRIPLREVPQRVAAIRSEAEQIAKRHQIYFWLNSEPSRVATE